MQKCNAGEGDDVEILAAAAHGIPVNSHALSTVSLGTLRVS